MENLNPIFSPSRMEKFTLKADSMFLSKAFQFIIAGKCNIKMIFYNVTRTFAYVTNYVVSRHALEMLSER